MKKIRKLIGEEIHDYLEESLKWVVMSLLIGIPCGLLGTLFHHSLRKANALRAAHPWLLFTLPLIGALIILLYHSCGMHTESRYKPPSWTVCARTNQFRCASASLCLSHNSDAAGRRQCRT